MKCPKCHKNISDDATVCPYCHKVLALTCPNCKTVSLSAVCQKCGYIILEKCSKCGKLVPTTSKKCKCGFDTSTSIAYNECEIDDFASVIVKFSALSDLRRVLGSQELYLKFLLKLKNLISAQIKGCNGHVILYGDSYHINFNHELSFQTSVSKAVRLGLKILTAFAGLNLRLIEQFNSPLKLTVTIIKKKAQELLKNKSIDSNVKLMILKNEEKLFLKGMQMIMDQYCQDVIREYKTDSLYSLDIDGESVMFYELLLDNYIVPPSESADVALDLVKTEIKKSGQSETKQPTDIYGFSIFDLNAKCKFQKCTVDELNKELTVNNKIVVLRGPREYAIKTSELIRIYEKLELNTIYITCTEDMNYKPWGFFEKLFKEYYKLSTTNGLIDVNFDAKKFNTIKQLVFGHAQKKSSAEDTRFSYMELFVDFLSTLKKYVIIVDGFEYLDDSSIQTLELYFDKFVKVYTNFVFITNNDVPAHSKIKGLLQTFLYTEITLVPNTIDGIISGLNEDASDFIKSFYYEKIKENFNGSKLYFEHAMRYLMDRGVLVNFDNKLIIKNYGSFILPKDLQSLIRTRLKALGKYQDASMILAYSVFIGERLDFKTLEALGINNIKENVVLLNSTGLTYSKNDILYINNYVILQPIILASLKKEVQEYILKTILAKIGKLIDNTSLLLIMGKLSMFQEQYMLLWKNTQLSMDSGDYDAYLKNCLGVLSLLDKIGDNIPEERLDAQKKEIYQNILTGLYAYSPSKIYSLSYILLMDAIEIGDTEKIARLSNLMLQGALITSNYTHALSLLHNIISELPNPTLLCDGKINTKYLLLSLINIEILFNIGDYINCIDVADTILAILKPDVIASIKPVNFSMNSFINHLTDTFRLVGFARLLSGDMNIEVFFNKVQRAINEDLPDKDSIIALRDFINGKNYTPSNIELNTPFSKVIFLILQELSNLKSNYKLFAQNIYQAKLLSADIHQSQLEYLCEILIAYAYAKVGINEKSDSILTDIIKKAEETNIFNIILLAKYVYTKTKIYNEDYDTALLIINDVLAEIQKTNNQAKIFYAMFEKLFIEIAEKKNIKNIDIESELNKLLVLSPNGEFGRILNNADIMSKISSKKVVISNENNYEIHDADNFSDQSSMSTEMHE